MSFLITWLVSRGLGETSAKIVLGVIAVLFFVGISATLKSCYDNRVIEHHEVAKTVEVLKKTTRSNDKAAEQRSKDVIRNDKQDTVRKEAIAKETDEPPSDASLALSCIRLREAGIDTSGEPACRGR